MNNKNGYQILIVFAILLFWIAAFLPEKLWGIHFLAFLSVPQKLVLLGVATISAFFPKAVFGFSRLVSFFFNQRGKLRIPSIFLIAGIFFGLFLAFPIVHDIYGDAYRFQNRVNTILKELPQGFVKDIFQFEFGPSAGRKTVLFAIGFLSQSFDITYLRVFKWVGAISGLGFSLLWIWYVREKVQSKSWQVVLVLIGLFAPLTQAFYQHVEAYAPVYFITLCWLVGYVKFYDKSKPLVLTVLTLVFPVLLKLHPISWLLSAPLIMAWVHVLNQNREAQSQKVFSFKKLSRFIIGLITVVGAIVYLVVLKDHADPRYLENIRDIDRLFLPIISPDPPLDRYNLLSINHLVDFFNAALHWSIPLVILFFIVRSFIKKSEESTSYAWISLSTLFVLQVMLLFMINPLVSMPMDWDLFSFPALTMMVAIVAVLERFEEQLSDKKLKSGLLGLVFLTACFIPVNANSRSISYRLESLGRHIFKTYYLHSNRILITAVGLHGDMNDYMERKNLMERELRPFALVGNDKLYANLFMDDGFYYLNTAYDYDMAKDKLTTAQRYNPESEQIAELLAQATLFADADDPSKQQERYYRIENFGLRLMRELREFAKAQSHFQSAIKEYPDSTVLQMFLMEARFQRQDYDGAYYSSLTLVEKSYPDKLKALRIAIHCALEAGMYQEAYDHSGEYLKLSPNDKLVSEIRERLENKDRPDELRLLFIRR